MKQDLLRVEGRSISGVRARPGETWRVLAHHPLSLWTNRYGDRVAHTFPAPVRRGANWLQRVLSTRVAPPACMCLPPRAHRSAPRRSHLPLGLLGPDNAGSGRRELQLPRRGGRHRHPRGPPCRWRSSWRTTTPSRSSCVLRKRSSQPRRYGEFHPTLWSPFGLMVSLCWMRVRHSSIVVYFRVPACFWEVRWTVKDIIYFVAARTSTILSPAPYPPSFALRRFGFSPSTPIHFPAPFIKPTIGENPESHPPPPEPSGRLRARARLLAEGISIFTCIDFPHETTGSKQVEACCAPCSSRCLGDSGVGPRYRKRHAPLSRSLFT